MTVARARRAPVEAPSAPGPSASAPTFAPAVSNQQALDLLAQAPASASPTSVLDAAGASSVAPALPVRGDPAPWAAQNRAVSFKDVPGGQPFQNGATPNDVVQGQNGSRYLGDCWLLSSLAAVAGTQPQLLQDAIRSNGDGTYTVMLHTQRPDGTIQAEPIRVDDDLPVTADGRDAYAQRQHPQEMWVGLIEKAFASRKGGYGNLDGGIPGEALTAITGRPSHTARPGKDPGALFETLRRNSAANIPTVAASASNLNLQQTGIVPGHGHTVLGTEEKDGKQYVMLRDPFAKYEPQGNGARDGVFRVEASEFGQRFSYVTWSEPEQAPPAPAPAAAPPERRQSAP